MYLPILEKIGVSIKQLNGKVFTTIISSTKWVLFAYNNSIVVLKCQHKVE